MKFEFICLCHRKTVGTKVHALRRLRSMGNPDLDFEIGISDFAIEREIRKQISLPRNPSSWWVSIKKSKSGFHGFPFYRSI